MANIRHLTEPKSIALIGASNNQEKIGYQILNNILVGGFDKPIYPINPKGGEILGLKVYSSLAEISESVELAIIVIPSVYVKDAVLECVQKGVKGLVIISAGFGEVGEDGVRLQKEIVEICEQNDITLLGPNCLGLINTDLKFNATFAKDMPKSGDVSFISQSGAIISSMIDWSKTSSIGFNKIFSLGNKALLKEADLLEYLYTDEKTKVIIGYIEKLEVDQRLTEVLIKYAKTKPTIILFGGKSAFGAQAAASHTGSIVSSYLSIKTYLTQAGVILADSMEDLLLFARVFSSYQKVDGKNIAIITNAGGPSIAASDALYDAGLSLAKLSEETMSRLEGVLKKEASVKNPIDILGDASHVEYENALKIVGNDKNVDAMIVLLTPQSATKISESALVVANDQSKKPILSSFVGGEILQDAKKIIESSGKPCFSFPEEAVYCLKALCNFSLSKPSLKQPHVFDGEYEESNKIALLKEFNLPVLEYLKADTIEATTELANKLGYPVVLKTADPAIVHKSDSGGVKLNIKNDSELKDAFNEIGPLVFVGKMIKGKHEIFLGIKKDPAIGTIIAFGTGGIYAEIYQDFAYRIAPINTLDAMSMIKESKIGEILSGARGQKPYDLHKIAEIIVNTANFAMKYKNVAEIDFNPIMVDDSDFYIVDTRIILS